MKRWIALLFITTAFVSCESGDGGNETAAGIKTVTGTVSGGSNVIIGAFSSDYWFTADFSGEEDVVYREYDADTSGEFTPVASVIPEGGVSYSIYLPGNPEDMGELIAWDDTDDDGIFDLGTETG